MVLVRLWRMLARWLGRYDEMSLPIRNAAGFHSNPLSPSGKGGLYSDGVSYRAVGSHRDVPVAGFVGGFGYLQEVFVDFYADAGVVG